MTGVTVETRAGITATIVSDAEGIVSVCCVTCGTALVDDDRSPFYDAATDDGTPHVCPEPADDDAEPVVSVSQERGHDGPWTARCGCGWSFILGAAANAQAYARAHGDKTGHDASNA